MSMPADKTIRTRFDGSIDIDHYTALGRAARAEQAARLAGSACNIGTASARHLALLIHFGHWLARSLRNRN